MGAGLWHINRDVGTVGIPAMLLAEVHSEIAKWVGPNPTCLHISVHALA